MMVASMGINPDQINRPTLNLARGSAIGLFAKVTSEPGSDHTVRSVMTGFVGDAANIRRRLAGTNPMGFRQNAVEWLYPGNTHAAQTGMIRRTNGSPTMGRAAANGP